MSVAIEFVFVLWPPCLVQVQCKKHGSRCVKWIMLKNLPSEVAVLEWFHLSLVDASVKDKDTHLGKFADVMAKHRAPGGHWVFLGSGP